VHRRGGVVVGEILDDAESRAEFKKRRGLLQLVARCESKHRDFDTIVARDESRIGAGNRALIVLDDILATGVTAWYYLPEPSGEQVKLDSPEAVLINSIKGYAAEKERAKTGERTREALALKARQGRNVGGRCFG
jgi:site-specific DNA recombinase